jgi:hypothetical protein
MLSRSCLLWVNRAIPLALACPLDPECGHKCQRTRCPLSGDNRTSQTHVETVENDPYATLASYFAGVLFSSVIGLAVSPRREPLILSTHSLLCHSRRIDNIDVLQKAASCVDRILLGAKASGSAGAGATQI